MNRIDILVAVDVEDALSLGTLQNCVYLVDSNGYIGSWQEGRSDLHTVCQDGQVLTWSVAAVDPGSDISITRFSAQAVDSKVCVPRPALVGGQSAWSGQVQSRGQFASFLYTVALTLDVQTLTFDAYLKVV